MPSTQSPSLLIKNGTLLTVNPRGDVLKGDVWIEDGQIRQVGGQVDRQASVTIDAHGKLVLPGFVQTHVHLCQTLMRGAADDLPLLEWLRQRIWPLEAAHDEATLRASARLGLAELLRGGTTAILTMETVHDTDVVFDEARRSGIRARVGKCFMNAGDGVPKRLLQPAKQALKECEVLHKSWRGDSDGRLGLALAPRFLLACTEALLRDADALAKSLGLLVHSHAAESREEVKQVRQQTGRGNIEAFHALGLLHERLCLAHCVWPTAREQRLLAERRTRVLHCPTSNLKLGSGIAPIWPMLQSGIAVSLGADGAPCNNNLDMVQEMRLAALLQKTLYGPEAMPAATVLRLATLGGAEAVGLGEQIGSLEAGKRADVIIVNPERLHSTPAPDPVAALVYSGHSSDVETTIVDGEVLMHHGELILMDRQEIVRDGQHQFRRLIARAGI